MITLKLRRSQPQAGKTVTVHVEEGDKNYGMLLLPFEVWIHFNKLLAAGQEANARQDYTIPLRIIVEGYVTGEQKKKAEEHSARTLRPSEQPRTIATPEEQASMQEEEDAEAQRLVDETKDIEPQTVDLVAKLTRTLREEPPIKILTPNTASVLTEEKS